AAGLCLARGRMGMQMLPTFSAPDAPYHRSGDTETLGEFCVFYGGGRTDYLIRITLRYLRTSRTFAAHLTGYVVRSSGACGRLNLARNDRLLEMVAVLRGATPLKVGDSVIEFVEVFVVDLLSRFRGSEERASDEPMNLVVLALSI